MPQGVILLRALGGWLAGCSLSCGSGPHTAVRWLLGNPTRGGSGCASTLPRVGGLPESNPTCRDGGCVAPLRELVVY